MRIARIFVGLGFTVVFLFVVWLAVFDLPVESRLDCSRVENACVVTQRLLTKQRSGTLPLGLVRGAEVKVSHPRRGAPRVSLYLLTISDSWFVADYGSTQQKLAQADADRLNSFLRNTDAALVIDRKDRWTYALMWFLIAGCAVLIGFLWWVLLRPDGTPQTKPDEIAASSAG